MFAMRHTSKILTALLLSIIPISYANATSITIPGICEQKDPKEVEHLAKQTCESPIVIRDGQMQSVYVFTTTDYHQPWTDERVVYIPEGWEYFNHTFTEVTGAGDRKVYEPWLIRDPKHPTRVVEVHIKVEAFSKWYERSWVGAQLNVYMVPKRDK